MNQEESCRKAISSILAQINPLNSTDRKVVFNHLKLIYGAGYDEGRKQRSHAKKVAMYKDGVYIKSFDDVTSAANSFHIHKSSISKAIKKGRNCKGYTWRLLEK